MFKAACEHEEVLDPGFCGGARAHSRPPRAIAPRGISDGAVHTPHALIHVLYGGATSGGSEAAMHTSVSAPRYGTMSRTFLHVASASLSYCKAGTGGRHCLILPGNPEGVNTERLSQPSLSDYLLLIRQT